MASDTNFNAIGAAAPADTGEKTVFKILLTISFCHLLNDTIQSLMPPIYGSRHKLQCNWGGRSCRHRREDRLQNSSYHQFLPSPERHDSIFDAADLSAAAENFSF